jgi:hypothetical protein
METQLNKIPEGIHLDMSIEDYHNDKEFVSASSVKESIKSLAHFNLQRNKKSERKSHFDFGNIFEIALLDWINGTLHFKDKVHIFDVEDRPEKDKGITSNINQAWKKGILNGSKYVISSTGDESMETLLEMMRACARDSTIQTLLRNTTYQESYFWTCPETGVKLKSRPDLRKNGKGVIIDVKTALDGSPKEFAKQCANLEYPVQAVMQMKGAIQSGAINKMEKYYWLVVEKRAPFNATVYEFNVEDWQFVTDKLNYYLTLIKQAMEESKFVGYSQQADNKYGILTLELPMFYRF